MSDLKVKRSSSKRKRRGKKREAVTVSADYLAQQPLLSLLPPDVGSKISKRMQHHYLDRDEVIYEG